MEPKFQTETVYTLNEYKRYNHAVLWQVKKVPVRILVIELILLGISYVMKDMTYILGALLVPLIFKLVFAVQAKKTYQNNPEIHDVHFVCSFYDDYMEQVSRLGKARIYYRQIQKILETGTHFYLMTEKSDGIIVVKENCSKGLIEFLKGMEKKNI